MSSQVASLTSFLKESIKGVMAYQKKNASRKNKRYQYKTISTEVFWTEKSLTSDTNTSK